MKRKPNTCAFASQVGFRDYKAVLKTKVEERVNAIVNRLNGTKRDVPHPDLAAEREAYEKEVRCSINPVAVRFSARQSCHGSVRTDFAAHRQCRTLSRQAYVKEDAPLRKVPFDV